MAAEPATDDDHLIDGERLKISSHGIAEDEHAPLWMLASEELDGPVLLNRQYDDGHVIDGGRPLPPGLAFRDMASA